MEVRKEFHHHRLWGNFSTFLKVSHLLSFLSLTKLTQGEPAWFQVCDQSHKFQLNSVDCTMGLWLKQPLRIGCVCVNGVWVLTNGFCDDQPIILVGDGDCFSIRKKIQSIKLLGNPNSPFSTVTYVATQDFSTFTKIPEFGSNELLDSSSSIVISINPKKCGFMRLDEQICLTVPEPALTRPVHIWKNSRRQSTSFKLVNETKCSKYQNYFDSHIHFGESYQGGLVKSIELASQNCSDECPTKPDHTTDIFSKSSHSYNSKSLESSFGRSISMGNADPSFILKSKSDSSFKTKIIWRQLFALNRKLLFTGGYGLSNEELDKRKEIYKERFKISEAQIEFSRETREQTVRMMQAHLNDVYLNQLPVKTNTKEYEYFEKARQLFLSVIPTDLIPIPLVNGMMRMWRQLVWETHDKFAYRDTVNEYQHNRIMQRLNECLANVSVNPMVFIDWKNASTHYCLNETQFTFWNASEDKDNPGHAYEVFISDTIIPADLVFDENKFDFVIELAWKIAMYAQKHCSGWFYKDTHEYSILSHKLDSLFNPPIVKRWYNPEESLKVYKMIFPNVNFRLVAFSVDRVGEAARDFSTMPNKRQQSDIFGYPYWLRRPKVPLTKNDLVLKRRGSNVMIKQKRLQRSTQQRYLQISRKGQFWGTRAYCMINFLDPVNYFNYNPPSNCLVVEPGI